MKDAVKKLEELSFNQVVIRAREYYLEHGTWSNSENMGGGVSITRRGKFYIVATEFQAIACHSLTYRNNREGGFIWLSYVSPAPRYYPTYRPLPFRSVVWTGKDLVSEAWKAVYESWKDVPQWLSGKPVVFCRQKHPKEGYTVAEATDIVFLRLVDHMTIKTTSHKNYHEGNLDDIARDTPMDKRGWWYTNLLRVHDDRRSLLETVRHRLTSFTDYQYHLLAMKLGTPVLGTIELPYE